MFLWRLLALLSCLLLLASALPLDQEVNEMYFFSKIKYCEQSTSISPGSGGGRVGPHHSLATLLYSVIMQVSASSYLLHILCLIFNFQEEAEDADISALP